MITVRRLYFITAWIGLLGFLALWPFRGFAFAVAFLLGALASLGNLYLFNYLTRAISPVDGKPRPWTAGAYISRYLLLFTGGYVIVKALSVNPLAVVLGLLASTAAVVVSSIFELVQSFFDRSTTH